MTAPHHSVLALQILKQILEAKEHMGDTMKTSFFSMTEAKYAAGDSIKHTIFDNVETAQVQTVHSVSIVFLLFCDVC